MANTMSLKERLDKIDQDIGYPETSDLERAKLEIEKIWINFRIGNISQEQRVAALDKFLDAIEEESPEIYEKLVKPNDSGLSSIQAIASDISKRK